MRHVALHLLLLPAAAIAASAPAATPHRGWRTWNTFGLQVNQSLMTSIMDAMVSRARSVDGVPTSLADLGYIDVGVDDGWQLDNSGPGGHGYHNASGYPNVNTSRFPSLAAMTAYGHAAQLRVGWYANNCHDAEAVTPAPLSHYLGDAAALRDFGFDSTKVDSCGGQKNMQLWCVRGRRARAPPMRARRLWAATGEPSVPPPPSLCPPPPPQGGPAARHRH